MITEPVDARRYGAAHTERVNLYWWDNIPTQYNRVGYKNLHWDDRIPVCHLIMFDCVGVVGKSKPTFEVQGILPIGRLPYMNKEEKQGMLDTLQRKLESQIEYTLYPMKLSLIDWDHIEKY